VGVLRIVVAGAAGRMGRNVIRAIAESDQFTLTAVLVRSGTVLDRAAEKTSNVVVTDDPVSAVFAADAIVDFSTPQTSVQLSALAAQKHVAHVIGTTGFSADQELQIEAAARDTAIVKTPNMSVGVTLLANLVKQTAKALPAFDIEILEMHHRMKVDTPSGTALLLGRAAAEGRGAPLRSSDARHGARESGAIGFASLRGGTVVGEHQVIFAGLEERIMLSHTAEDRTIFARGALLAAQWAQGRPSGLYNMNDVLGLPN
jgi:4-hydroxy-tetrahydrodipicolinate reductase